MQRKSSVPLFKGKNKTQVTEEAIRNLGLDATKHDANNYAKRCYGIGSINPSLFYSVKSRVRKELSNETAASVPEVPADSQPDVFKVIRQLHSLASDVGGYERLRELIDLVQNKTAAN